jgi:hypothetical protein
MPNWFLVVLIVVAALCQACAGSKNSIGPIADKTKEQEWADHSEGEYALRILVPYGWETYNTDAGIVLNEMIGANAPDTPLHGLLIHVFVPDARQFRWPDETDVNLAWYILKQVVHNPDYVGNARISEPVAFDWDHHEAAYYLLNNLDGTVTMLLAMEMPNGRSLVVCHISVPDDQTHRIRQEMPDLLATLTIDGQQIDVSALRSLPDPLVFPEK